METNNIFIAYCIYLPMAVALTIYVSRQLFSNSKVFMLDIFHGREEIALSTNKLFETGFYLMNLGFALLILKIEESLMGFNSQRVFEVLSFKLGGFSIYLCCMLFANLYLFFRGKRKSRENTSLQQKLEDMKLAEKIRTT